MRKTMWQQLSRLTLLMAFVLLASATTLHAQGELPALHPPIPEIPPSFWERYGIITVAASILIIAGAVGLWIGLRRRVPEPEPIAVTTRKELARLATQPETGRQLMEISRVLRRYLIAAFQLPAAEMTTAEFSRALLANEKIGAELAAEVGDYLRRCDELKFSPQARSSGEAAKTASELFEAAERRRQAILPNANPNP